MAALSSAIRYLTFKSIIVSSHPDFNPFVFVHLLLFVMFFHFLWHITNHPEGIKRKQTILMSKSTFGKCITMLTRIRFPKIGDMHTTLRKSFGKGEDITDAC